MSAPPGRHATTAVTLGVLVLVVIAIGWWGLHKLTAPFPDQSASDSPTCSKAETSHTKYVHTDDVTVSVYNAGTRQGYANLTLQRLEARGFHPGSVANAPAGTKVAKARVLTTEADSAAAKLVARNLGKHIKVEVVDEDHRPLPPGRRRIRAARSALVKRPWAILSQALRKSL